MVNLTYMIFAKTKRETKDKWYLLEAAPPTETNAPNP